MAPKAGKWRDESRRNRSKPCLEITRDRTKPEWRSSKFELAWSVSRRELESVRIETEEARLVAADPLALT